MLAEIPSLFAEISAIGFLVGVVLHNMVYALRTFTEDLAILDALLNFPEVDFFLAAVVICPIGLLIGVVGTLILWEKCHVGNTKIFLEV